MAVAALFVGPMNAGMVMAFGGALSISALVRAIGEKNEAAGVCAVIALLFCLFVTRVGLAMLSRG